MRKAPLKFFLIIGAVGLAAGVLLLLKANLVPGLRRNDQVMVGILATTVGIVALYKSVLLSTKK